MTDTLNSQTHFKVKEPVVEPVPQIACGNLKFMLMKASAGFEEHALEFIYHLYLHVNLSRSLKRSEQNYALAV